MSPEMTAVDFGAGRGQAFHSQDPRAEFYKKVARIQGKVKRVIGVDIDDGIKDHPFLDERHIIRPGEALPLEPVSVDLVVADWVLEHVADPAAFATEMMRVLKPGGWLCARTVNRWGYVGIGARFIPNRSHKSSLKKLWPERFDVDVFPTMYRLNSLADIRRYFGKQEWDNCSYLSNATPKYFGSSGLLFRCIDFYQGVVPYLLRTDLLVFLKKK